MKWIKFLKDYDTHKAGEIVSLPESEVKVLVKAGFVEETTEPAQVTTAANDAAEELKTFVTDQIKAGFNDIKTSLKSSATATTKRPAIATHDNAEDDPTFGFKSLGEQIRSIKGWFTQDEVARKDERMKRIIAKAPSTYGSEASGADGGFLLAPQFANVILQHSFDDEALFTRTDTYTTASNSLTVPKDETTPWGTAGVQVYWQNEAAQATQSKPKLGQDNLILHKLTALVPVTDEQLQDSFTGLGDYISRQAGDRIRWKVDDAIINGTGAGQPMGIINSGALVSQAAESGQTATTINIANIANMISRIPQASIKTCVWLVHPKAFPQIVTLTNGNNSLYIPPGGVGNVSPTMGSLFGIPMVISQHCQTLGTAGDIYLLDLSKYLTLTKGDGIQSAMSIHLFFDYNVSTFRFNFRVAGQPWLSAPVTSANGSYTMSPFVNLAAR